MKKLFSLLSVMALIAISSNNFLHAQKSDVKLPVNENSDSPGFTNNGDAVSTFLFASSQATILGTTSNDDNIFSNNPIGFTFTFKGTPYTAFGVNVNGWIYMGSAVGSSSYTPLSTGITNNVISALGRDLQGQTGSVLSYQTIGTAPNRVLIVKWSNYRKYSATGDNFNFEIRLYETSNKIEIVYGAFTVNTTPNTVQVGLRGASNADFNNRTTTTNWAATTAGGVNTASCTLSNTVFPASNQSFAWTGTTPISSYTFTGTAVPILGTTSNDDDIFANNPIGFSFTFDGTPYTAFGVNVNGWIYMGSAVGSSSYSPLSTGTTNNVISALGQDIQGQTGSVLSYQTIGTAPNRILIVRWSKYRKYLAAGDNFNFEIRLYETSNKIEIVYGAFTVNATSTTVQAGLRGASNADFNNRTTTTNWSATTAGAVNTASCTLSSAVFPSAAQLFTWSGPVPMVYVSSTSTQTVTSNVGTGTNNAQVIGLQVVMNGSSSPISLSSFDLSTNGSTDPPGDITNAKLWYTGTSSTFATTTQFGSTYNGPNGPFTITGTQALSNGTNYFWLTYDVPGSATSGNTIDGEFLSVTGGGSMGSQSPSITNPGSGRLLQSPLSGTYTVGLTAMRELLGKDLRYEPRTRKVKVMVPDENYVDRTIDNKDQNKKEETSTSHLSKDALNRPLKEVEIEETYYELTENGKKYEGPNFVSYKNATKIGNNSGNTTDLAGAYTTITAAVTDLNSGGVSGPVTFVLIDNGNYAGETYPIQFNNNISGISAVNTVTLKPQTGIVSTIPGNINANATIRILSNYVTIDGSNSGGTDRSLTIQNNSVTTPSVVLVGSTGTTPITNVMIKNCTITNGVNSSSAVVVSDAGTLGNPGYFNTVTIQNCLLEKAYFAIFANGGTTTPNGQNLFVYNNSINSTGTNAVAFTGVGVQGCNTGIISQNTIANFEGTASQDDNGIWIAQGCSNFTIERNNISALNYTGTGGYGGHGVHITTVLANANITVKNNMIYNLSGDGWNYTTIPTDNPIGICVGSATASTQSGINIYNNSIYLSGNTLNGTSSLSMGVFIGNGATGIDLRNNAIVNNLGLLGTTGTGSTCVYLWSAASQLTTASYNCYYSNATGSGTKNIGNIVSAFQTTIAGWRTATGKEVESFNSLPLFVSGTNLHIQISDLTLNGRGTYIASVNSDYDADSRPTAQSTSVGPVDVGCDQYQEAPFGSYNPNICAISGDDYYDGGLIAVEVVSGSIGVTEVRQYPGVRTPNNTLLKNGSREFEIKNPVKNTESPNKKLNKTKRDGTSGGQTDAMAVNVPWIYWELTDLTSPGASIRFYFNEEMLATILEADLKLSFWNGSAWDNGIDQTVNTSGNYIELSLPGGFAWGSTALFAMADGSAPLPVVLSSFDAAVMKRDVSLSWATESEINNQGFSVERRIKSQDNRYSEWKEVAFVEGKGNTTTRQTYNYSDKKLNSGTYQYRLKQVDFNGNYEYHSPSNNADLVIGKPGVFDISQNYPNPSNPTSNIDFQMPFDGKVSLRVYDILGKEVATLVDGYRTADFYTAKFDGTNLSTGVYFYRIIADNGTEKFTKTLKMILVK